jgi:DNA-binding NtrC family response regulator
MQMLVSWIGTADLRAPDAADETDIGPVGQAIKARQFDRLLLLADQDKSAVRKYEGWLRAKFVANSRMRLNLEHVELTSPTNFDDIYTAVTDTLEKSLNELREQPRLTFHLSPGTPAMAAIWVILGKTRYKAELIQSSKQKGVETASVPFDIKLSPEFVEDVLRIPDRQLEKLSAGSSEDASGFSNIIYQGTAMSRLVEKARKAARRSVPVLIEGESGTGKELLARAIHQASPRSGKKLQVVNCGAIPSGLVESELFGHKKGAFTDATSDHVGHFKTADRGTLFLDEIGELSLSAQVKLLRVVQDGEVRRVGDSTIDNVDVRIIAATNRDLAVEVAAGKFREDLFYRLAVLVLKVPPLRERKDDLSLLIDGLLKRVNEQTERSNEPGFRRKILSSAAKEILMREDWPGNIRQLENTLRRAVVWSEKDVVSPEEIEEALLPSGSTNTTIDSVMNHPIERGVDIQSIVGIVVKHYLQKAIEVAHGNKSRAAELVGLSNYQTFTNWMRKYGVTADWQGTP